ncbi:MAG: response regulator transcription factor, partial [Anaerolineaceae bacterium]|nr:response regulator transcription factor [Anaerolineaceae bacterium]
MTKILVVDDEPLYTHLLKVNLEPEGYEVTTATNGEEALEIVSSKHPDLVIMDVMMPKLDGITTCERIRQFSSVPIIMLTAKGEEQDRVQGLNVGADDYVVKPFSATELVARVRAVLRRARTTEEDTQSRFFLHGNLRIDFARAEVWK